MITETQWDLEVDVVCIGAEGAVLAAGLVAANAGMDTYLGVTDTSDGGGDLATPLGYRGGDGQTTRHLAGFDYAFGGSGGRAHNFWPVRAVEDVAPPRSQRRGAIEPFFGAALEQWAYRCAAAPHGIVYDRVSRRQMTEMRSARGEKIEAAIIGSVDLSPGVPALSLTRWLRIRAAEADLSPEREVRLVKLIFEDDGVAGALVDTRDGVLAVRATENLVIGVGEPAATRTYPLVSATDPVTVNVCLVSKAASRFGELEIVTATGDDNRLLFVDAPEAELQLTG